MKSQNARLWQPGDRPGGDCFEYRGWQVEIEVRGSGDFASWYAALSFQGKHVCRVGLFTRLDRHAARWALNSKACDFIDDWFARPSMPACGFQDLLS